MLTGKCNDDGIQTALASALFPNRPRFYFAILSATRRPNIFGMHLQHKGTIKDSALAIGTFFSGCGNRVTVEIKLQEMKNSPVVGKENSWINKCEQNTELKGHIRNSHVTIVGFQTSPDLWVRTRERKKASICIG